MAAHKDTVLCGTVMGVHGVRGGLRIRSDTTPKLALANYRPWRLIRGEVSKDYDPFEVREHGKGLVARLKGIDERDTAAELIGCDIAVPRSALPPVGQDEYYWHDLVGLSVTRLDGQALGTVSYMLETGAHDVMVLDNSGSQTLVPFVVGDTVVAVRLDDRCIVVDWDWD